MSRLLNFKLGVHREDETDDREIYVLMKKRPSPDKKFIIIHSDAMISSAFVLEGTKFSFKRI